VRNYDLDLLEYQVNQLRARIHEVEKQLKELHRLVSALYADK
jgi:uncharacterized protein YigA (DUF484 family)